MSIYIVAMSLAAEQLLRADSALGPIIILYVGPDQILPLTSILGAIIGILLICWRYVVGVAGKVWHFFRRH